MPSQALKAGDLAPDFTLSAANQQQIVSVKQLLQRGPVVVEFLRGTW